MIIGIDHTVERGLDGVLVISDPLTRLRSAINHHFQRTAWLRTIFARPDHDTASAQLSSAQLHAVADQLEPVAPGVTERLLMVRR